MDDSGESTFWERSLATNMRARGLGLGFCTMGALVFVFVAYLPLKSSVARRELVFYYPGVVAIAAIFALVGLLLIIAGKNSSRFVATRHGQSLTPLQKMTAWLGAFGALALEMGFRAYLRSMGLTEWH